MGSEMCIRDSILREQKVDVADYVKKATSTSKTSLGDVFGDALKGAGTSTATESDSSDS